ncbi:MAG TPA: DUF2235 domain-containing protein [Terriglobia bacterium]|nr:DUF2235 domain-containing protein [Terriglobia bacterium]
MRRLVLCFDGTWNSADGDKAETNVVRIARAIHATQDTGGVQQSVLYLRGIGATGLNIERIVDGATGLGIDDIIRSGYMFLAQNYLPGDEIFLFGFSRGAFTARSVAGFIGSCGLLKRQKLSDLGKAWDYYRKEGPHSPEDFKNACGTDCHLDVEIRFLGVWDTVGALGIPTHFLGSNLVNQRYGFHDTSPSHIVKHGCHALAIDEERDEFVPTLWTGTAPAGSVIEQVWFSGCHSDVGGGFVDRGLADIPLVWMAKKAEADGLAIDWSVLPDAAILDPLASQHDPRQGWSAKDRLTPTFRCVCETMFNVSPFEALYRPLGGDGKPLPTINEALHSSVVARFGKPARFSDNDIPGKFATGAYRSRNLVPLFNGSAPIASIAVAS